MSTTYLKKRKRINNIAKLIFALGIVIVAGKVYNEVIDYRDGCQRTGEQRLTNSMTHASDSALSTLVVEDKFVCKNNRVTWKVVYN